MIFYLYGPDSYRRNKKTKDLIDSYRAKHKEADIASFDLEEAPEDWRKAGDFLGQPSMFVDSKIAVIRESGEVEPGKEKEWAKIIKSQIETPKTFLIISDRESPKAVFKFLLKEPVKSQEFPELSGRLLETFLKTEAAARDLAFEPEAWRYFLGFLESQTERSWRGIMELEKFHLARFPKPIPLKNVRLVIPAYGKENVFFLLKKILEKRSLYQSLASLESLFLQKEAPPYLFNLLSYQAYGAAAVRLADYDVSVKSGGLEYEEALTDFVISEN